MTARLIAASLISVVVLALFGFALWAVVFKAIPGANSDVAKMIVGSLATMAAGVVYYWTGSTISGGHKDATIAEQSKMLAAAQPPPPGA